MACGKTLLGDIGGTTARFTVLTGDALGPVDHLPVSHYRSPIDSGDEVIAAARKGLSTFVRLFERVQRLVGGLLLQRNN